MQGRKWARVGMTTDGNVIHFLIINVPRLYSALHTPINILTEPLSHKVHAVIHTQVCAIPAERMDLDVVLWMPDEYKEAVCSGTFHYICDLWDGQTIWFSW